MLNRLFFLTDLPYGWFPVEMMQYIYRLFQQQSFILKNPALAIILSLHKLRDVDGVYVRLQRRWLENVYVVKVFNLSDGNQYLQSKCLKCSA